MKVKSDLDENEFCLVAGSCFEQNQDIWNLFPKEWTEPAQLDNSFLELRYVKKKELEIFP